MRKIKIFITFLVLYEFIMLTILQINKYCIGFFAQSFCNIPFRYFLLCIVIPVLVALLAWWMPDISKILCKKCQCEIKHEEPIKDALKEIITKQDIERLITAAVVMGIQKFTATHPKTKETLGKILKTVGKNNDLTKL